jgi:transcriptional regulator GlxA family with amidase domain
MVVKRAGEPVRMAFLLMPQFSMMAFSAALEPLRSANRLTECNLFEWQLVSADGKAVTASNGISIAVDRPIADVQKLDLLAVCGGIEPGARNQKFHHHLRRLARHGTLLGALSSGSFVLAEAGLLTNRRCTVHWEYAELFRTRFPTLKVTQDLYVIDRDVFTCSGGTAGLDMMLHFVGEIAGSRTAVSVAEQFIHPLIRTERDHQRAAMHARYGIDSPRLVQIIRLMEGALEEPLDLAAIADKIGISSRQVERLFRNQMATSPRAFYLQLRLAKARMLLRHTLNPVRNVALECGFTSTSHLCRAYKQMFGIAPTTERHRPGVDNDPPSRSAALRSAAPPTRL